MRIIFARDMSDYLNRIDDIEMNTKPRPMKAWPTHRRR